MKHKLSCVLVVISFLMLGLLGGAVPAKNNNLNADEIVDDAEDLSKKYFEIMQLGENKTEIVTGGPIGPFLNIAEINIIDGEPLKVILLRWILNTHVRFIRRFVPIEVSDITFSIRYTKKVLDLPLINRCSYCTYIGGDYDVNFSSEKHTLIVSGFNGTFGYFRKPIRLYPAYFSFTGYCDDLILLT